MPMSETLAVARAVAIDAALRAGALLRANLYGDKGVQHKGAIDLVTQSDTAAQRLVIERIRETFPDHAILAEEETGEGEQQADHRWIIDPLDGTTNFVHTIPHFAVSIAFERRGRLEVGVVYDPSRDELFEATMGEGAHLNGRPIRVSGAGELEQSILGTGFPYDRQQKADVYLRFTEAFMRRTQGIRRFGAASLDLAYVACGRLDGFWEFKLKPWDVAAGMVLIHEAGGVTLSREGGPATLDGQQIVAANPALAAAMVEVARELPDPLG